MARSMTQRPLVARFTSRPRARWLLPFLAVPLACQGPPTGSDEEAPSDLHPNAVHVQPAAGPTGGTPPPLPVPPPPDPSSGLAVPPSAPLPPSLAPLPERGADGKPVLYYGRVQITDPAQLKLLKAFGFVHDRTPFFDDYRPNEVRRADTPVAPGPVWAYAIASGAQWNFLRKYPGLVGAIEMNPRLGSAPHPALDSFIVAGGAGALDTTKLIAAGFNMRPIRLRAACVAPETAGGPPGVQPQSFIGDAWDSAVGLLEDAAGGLARLIAKGVGLTGSELAAVLEAAVNGAVDAINFIRELANSGYCALAGKTSNSGVVYVNDNHGRVLDVGSRNPTPLRWGTMKARGGPLGVLLTEAHINRQGQYAFDDLCKGVTYKLAVKYEDDPALVTADGVFASEDDVTSSTGLPQGQQSSVWDLETAAGIWFMGAQLGWDFSVQQLGFAPKQVHINHGFLAEDVIGTVNDHRPVATCGENELLISSIGAFPGLAAVAPAALRADIFGISSGGFTAGHASWIGVAMHEYGHFAFCEGLDRYGPFAAKEAYLATLTGSFFDTWGGSITPASGAEQTMHPVRNSAEAWADLFAYRALGYTDYVSTLPPTQGANQSSQCPINPNAGNATSGSICLEPDAPFQLPANTADPNNWPGVLASRLGVMHDWVDGPGGDDRVNVPLGTILKVATSGSANITTESIAGSLAASLSGQPPTVPAEDICEVFFRHGWPCNSIGGPVVLDAPTNFDGAAFNETAIAWSWSPSSTLADQYVVVSVENGAWVDGLSTPATGFSGVLGVADLRGDTPVTAAVESRRAGSPSARSIKVTRCTTARKVEYLGGSATVTVGGVEVVWTAPRATKFRIRRRPTAPGGGGDFSVVATVSATGAPTQTFVDVSAPPGIGLQYVVDSVNCDGVVTLGDNVFFADPSALPEDLNVVYVQAGLVGGTGRRAQPVGTFAEALPLLTAARNVLAVSEGTYAEVINFDEVPASVGSLTVFGGYEAGFYFRDPALFTTRLIGTDGFDNEISTGTGEFRRYYNPLIRSQNHDLRVEGISFLPASRSCPATCSQLDFFYGRRLELVASKLEATGGDPRLGGSPLPPALIEAQSCQLEDTSIEGAGSTDRLMVRCDDANVDRSEIFAGTLGAAVTAHNARITGSVVRGSSTEWSGATGGTGIVASGCLFVRSSLVAGFTAVNATPLAPCPPDEQGIFRTLTYGEVIVARTRIANSVLMGERSPIVRVVAPTGCESQACLDGLAGGNVVRGNLFVQLSGEDALATTQFRNANGLGPLLRADVNDSDAWFGPFPNDVGGNREAVAAAGIFDASVVGPGGPVEWDPGWRGNRGRVWHFQPDYDAAFGANLSLYGVPDGPTLDQGAPGAGAVGPY